MNVSGPDRRVVRAIIAKALTEYTDKISEWDGDLCPLFVERLSVLCAMSRPFLTPREVDVLVLDCQVFTPEQIEDLTGHAQPEESRDRRLTDAEIGIILGWSEPTIERTLSSAYRKVLKHIPPEMLHEFDASAIDSAPYSDYAAY